MKWDKSNTPLLPQFLVCCIHRLNPQPLSGRMPVSHAEHLLPSKDAYYQPVSFRQAERTICPVFSPHQGLKLKH